MDIQIQTVILSGVIGLASSIITARITNRYTKEQIEASHKNALIELFADKKSQLYVECYGEVEKLQSRPFIIFESKYIEKLKSFESEITIRGSAEVCAAYKELLEYVSKIYKEAFDYSEYISEQMTSQNDYDMQNGEGEPKGCIDFRIDCAIDKYQQEHAPDKKKVDELVGKLVASMKADMGIG